MFGKKKHNSFVDVPQPKLKPEIVTDSHNTEKNISGSLTPDGFPAFILKKLFGRKSQS